MKFKDSVPVVATADVRATVDYYNRVLGFREHFIFGDPPVYAGVERDGVLLYITHDPSMAAMLISSGLHPDIFLWVQDVDSVFAEHRKSGAKIIEEVSDRPWDARQYVVEDPNGYRLKIAEPIDERANQAAATMPIRPWSISMSANCSPLSPRTRPPVRSTPTGLTDAAGALYREPSMGCHDG